MQSTKEKIARNNRVYQNWYQDENIHDDVIKWKHFPRYWPFVRGIHRPPVNSRTQRPVTRSFDVFFDLHPNKRLSKQWWGWWFETPSCPLWRYCKDIIRFMTINKSCVILLWLYLSMARSMNCFPKTIVISHGCLCSWDQSLKIYMMTSSKGSIFRVTGPLCGEFTGPGGFPAQRPVTRSFDVFFDLCLNKRFVNNREAGDLRRHRGHYDVKVMVIPVRFPLF